MLKPRKLLALALLIVSLSGHAVEQVDVELQLLIDISGSVDAQEYDLQMQGYKAAFESDAVQDAILAGEYGKIAVQLIMWSGADQQAIMIDWALIDSAQSADDFASLIDSLTRPFAGWTATGSAVSFAYPEFSTNDFDGTKQVIDVSGDGILNQGSSVADARDEALAAGVDTINGIVITTDQAVIDEYANEVVGGDNAFLLAPATFDDFQAAIETKLVAEIQGTTPEGNLLATPVPEPPALGIMLFGLIYLMFTRKSKIGACS